MKKIVALLLVSLVLSCATKKPMATISKAALLSDCPTAGTCTVELFQNKSMVLQFDNNRNNYTLVDNLEKNVVVCNYTKTVKGNLQDAGYREEVIFETEKTLSDGNFQDADLQNRQMLFGRFCYCKGQTGYYKVSNGKMQVDANGNIILDFSISEVPQIINHIKLLLK
jgi:hypothetical protein